MAAKPPFIGSQRISLLRLPDREDPKPFLSDAGFRPFAEFGDITQEYGWTPVLDRESFLSSLFFRRLVLTETGGIGKTTALKQVRYLLSISRPRHLCLQVEAADLPDGPDGYIGRQESSLGKLQQPLLVKELGAQPGFESMPSVAIRKLISQKIQNCQFTLLIDALDQVDLDRQDRPRELVIGLSRFLRQYPSVRCVLTGRPYSVSHYWDRLADFDWWAIAAVAPFEPSEQRVYLGPRMKLLDRLDAKVIANPRALHHLLELSEHQLKNLRTAADVYWEALKPIIEKGVANQSVLWQGEPFTVLEIVDLFSLLAMEMHAEGRFVRVNSVEYEEFCSRVFERRTDWLRSKFDVDSRRGFARLLDSLGRLNIAIESAIVDDYGMTSLSWHDRTLQDFFAAVWLAKHCDACDLEWLTNVKPIAGLSNSPLISAWRFAGGAMREGR